MTATAVAKNILMSIEMSVNVENVIVTLKQKIYLMKTMELWWTTLENVKAANDK
jgi:hypothetical protein